MVNTDSGFINLTMHLWSSRMKDEYIEVTATWANSTFALKEALLTIQPLPLPHTAEAIKDSLNQVITNWDLQNKFFVLQLTMAPILRSQLD